MHEDVDAPPSAADALAIIEREQARTGATVRPDLVLMHAVWGLAYLVGGVAYYLYAVGLLGAVPTVAVAATAGVAAAVASTVAAVRGGRGTRSATALRDSLYGFSWPIALVLTYVLALGLSTDLDGTGRGRLIGTVMVFVVGVLYLQGGVVWSVVPQYLVGAWTMGVAVASSFVPFPAHVLVLSVGSGSGFLVLALWYRLRLGRS